MPATNPPPERVCIFGPFRLFLSTRLLMEGERVVRLGSRASEILVALVERAGELVSKRELMEIVWPNTVVVEANLAVHVAALRRALGENDSENPYIVNSPGRGYRFVAPIRLIERVGTDAEHTVSVSTSHNLPIQLTRLIGRSDLLKDLQHRMHAHRLVSLVGPAGVGKSSIAVSLAESCLAEYPDGVWFVDLASIYEGDHVASAVASALPIEIRSTDQISGMVAALRKKRLLLLIDNCEHVIESVADVISTILRASPTIHVLATSRESICIGGEHVHRVESLAFPARDWNGDSSAAMAYSAIQLFVERARGVVNGFALPDAEVAAVCEICRKLDGNPLAIELAAARVDAFGTRGLQSRIANFHFLRDSHRGTSPRQRSLKDAVDWSYQLLSLRDQFVLRCLAIFAGSFTLEAATSVVPGGSSEDDTPAAIAGLVSKSLVAPEPLGDELRFRLPEITRVFARTMLAEHGETDEIAARHCRYFEALLTQPAGAERRSNSDVTAMVEIDNIRSALTWAFASEVKAWGVKLAANAAFVWLNNSLLRECMIWSKAGINALRQEDLGSHSEMLLQAALGLASMFAQELNEQARVALTRACSIAQDLDQPEWELRATLGLVLFAHRTHDSKALQLAEKAVALARSVNDVIALGMAESEKGATLFLMGELEEAYNAAQKARRFFDLGRDNSRIARWGTDSLYARCVTGRICWHRGLFDQARDICFEVQSAIDVSSRPTVICQALSWCNCGIFLNLDDQDRSAASIGRLLEVAEANGLESFVALGIGYRGRLAFQRGQYEDAERDIRTALRSHISLRPPFLGFLADVLRVEGRFEEALDASTEALELTRGSGSRWWLPEMLRTHGEVMRTAGRATVREVEVAFREAIAISAAQGALALELRAVTSLLPLLADSGRPHEAANLLEGVLARFVEGHETSVLMKAKRQLAHISLKRLASVTRQ